MRSQAWSPSSPFGMTNQAAPMYHTYRPQKHNMAGLTAVIQWIRQTGCAVLGTYLSTLRYEKCVFSVFVCDIVELLLYLCYKILVMCIKYEIFISQTHTPPMLLFTVSRFSAEAIWSLIPSSSK